MTTLTQQNKAITEAVDTLARAKSLATPVASHVAARLHPGHLLERCSWQELAALVVVLAEAADHAKLKVVVTATEDSEPVSLRQVQLRKAHAEATRRRRAYEPVPPEMAAMAREYKTQNERARRASARQAAEEGAA